MRACRQFSGAWPAVLCLLLFASAPATAAARTDPTESWNAPIAEAASRFNLPARWIREVMRHESNGRPAATSWTGAAGLMQLMPGTYRGLSRRYGLGPDPYDPHDNVMAGAAYLREMYDQYGAKGFLAAYNAGPLRAQSYLAGGTLPGETIAYLSYFARRLGQWTGLLAAPPPAPAGLPETAANTVSPGVSYGSAAGGARRMASLEAAGTGPITIPPPRWAERGRFAVRPLPLPPSSAPAPAPVPRLVLAMATARRFHALARPMPAPMPLPDAAAPPSTFDAVYRVPDPDPDPAALPAGTVAGAHGDWGVELGDYPGQEAAREAAGRVAAALLRHGAGGQPVISPVERGGRGSYRAELVGLDGAQAVMACNDLIRQDQRCLTVPPKP